MSELDEKKKRKKAGTESSKESSLRDWFKRKGAKGSKGGWVDCNAPDGKGGYKSCGRKSGEKRKKYPACRPTPGACKERGKGKSWGKKGSKKKRNENMELTTEQIRKIILEELTSVMNEQDSIASKLDRLYAAKDENSKNQMRQLVTSLSDDPEVRDWIASKVQDLDTQISQVQTEIDKWEKIVGDLEKAGMDTDNYYADEAAEDAFHTFESEVWPRRQQKNQLEQEKKMLISHEIMESAKKDACYHKVKARYDVWPSAYASGALVKCRKVGAANWGNKSKKKNESLNEEYINEEEMTPAERKELKKIRDELKAAVKLHKSQADRIGDMVNEDQLEEAEYRGRKVKLNKPMRGDVKKFKVYVKDPKTGNIKKVNFGHGGTSAKRKGEKTMKIKKSNPKRRKSFRARHNCDNPGPKTKARYWSCRKW
tara:strand:+ start:141 stop:1418 length:1278 start_codon:yes stop_codon:yes gene_type:complete